MPLIAMTCTIEFSLQWSLRTWMFCLFEKLTFLNLLCFFQICFLLPFIYVCVFPACMSMYHIHAWHLCWAEQGIRSLGTGITDSCELWRRYWEWKPGPMAEQPLRLLLQPWRFIFIRFYVYGHFACVYTCATHACSTSGSQKKCWILWTGRTGGY